MALKCPACGFRTLTVNTRETDAGNQRRRRQCQGCGTRFNTIERVIHDEGKEWTTTPDPGES